MEGVIVTERKTRIDYAQVLKALSDDYFPQATCIVLVQDNLNTHSFSSLYEAFEPVEARRIRERFEVHYTPKHGSWLNMAEIELNVLGSQCLNRRIKDLSELRHQVSAWTRLRNQSQDHIQWRFTTHDARIKLQRLYPIITALSDQ